jgi:hypothetical protein
MMQGHGFAEQCAVLIGTLFQARLKAFQCLRGLAELQLTEAEAEARLPAFGLDFEG